jgi:hypothetical protein
MITNGYQPIIPKKELSESEKLQKELLKKAVKDQNTLRLTSSSINRYDMDKELAAAIYQLAEISFNIINHINKNKDRIFVARKFIEHYQDKAVLLCRKYCSMSEATSVVIDDEFINTKSNIRKVLIGFVDIFNNEYKKITDVDNIDINAELSVLIEDMQQQGINIDDIEEVDEKNYNLKKEKIQQVYDDIEDKLDSINLDNLTNKIDEEEPSTVTLKRNKTRLYNSLITPPWFEKPIDMRTQKSICDICEKYEKAINIGSCEVVVKGTERFEKEYAEIWYEYIASKEEKEYIHKIKIRYILLALIGIVPFHKWYLCGTDSGVFTYLRSILAIFIIPLFISWYEALSALVGTDKDFLINAKGYKKVISNDEIISVYTWWAVNIKNK